MACQDEFCREKKARSRDLGRWMLERRSQWRLHGHQRKRRSENFLRIKNRAGRAAQADIWSGKQQRKKQHSGTLPQQQQKPKQSATAATERASGKQKHQGCYMHCCCYCEHVRIRDHTTQTPAGWHAPSLLLMLLAAVVAIYYGLLQYHAVAAAANAVAAAAATCACCEMAGGAEGWGPRGWERQSFPQPQSRTLSTVNWCAPVFCICHYKMICIPTLHELVL